MSFVTVHTSDDPILVEALVQVLRAEGVNARQLGTRNAALIGVAPHILQLRIEAPSAEAERAHELIDAFLTAHPAHPDDPAMREWGTRPARRSPVVAGGAAFIVPGGSHFYAYRPATGAVLALAMVAMFAVLVTTGLQSWAAVTFGGLVACDLLDGQRAVRAWNAGERMAVGRQLVQGVLMVMLVLCVSMLLVTAARI